MYLDRRLPGAKAQIAIKVGLAPHHTQSSGKKNKEVIEKLKDGWIL